MDKFLNKITCGDSYQLIKELPNKCVDLVITDPPYEFVMGGKGHSEIAGGGCFGTKNRSYHSELAPTDVTKDKAAFVSDGFDNVILDELCRVMKKINIYVWCNKFQLRQLIDYFDDKECNIDLLTWNKTNPIPTCNNTYLSDIEYCVFARENGVKVEGSVETKSKWWTTPCNTYDKGLFKHPTIKPLERTKHYIINSLSKGGGIVFDPFAGSGTTCVAAKQLGRQYIGFEINPKWAKIAEDRLNGIDANGQMNMFLH